MKLTKTFLLSFICLMLLAISLGLNFYFYIENYKLNNEISDVKKNISDTYEYLDSITVSNFERKVISGDDFYVYIGRPDCGDCLLFEPMFRNVVNNYKLNDKILYMNVKHFRENNKNKWELFKNKYGFTQTPALIHFNHGKNISMIEWDNEKGLSHNRLVDWLQSNDLINDEK